MVEKQLYRATVILVIYKVILSSCLNSTPDLVLTTSGVSMMVLSLPVLLVISLSPFGSLDAVSQDSSVKSYIAVYNY